MKSEKEFVKEFGFSQTDLKSSEGLRGHSSVVSECLVNLGYIYLFKYRKWFDKNDSYTEEDEQILKKLRETNDVILKYSKCWIPDIEYQGNNYSALLYVDMNSGYDYEVASCDGKIIGSVKNYDKYLKQVKVTDKKLIQKILNLSSKKVINKKYLKFVKVTKEESEVLIRY
jgi:hypothetical protein